MSKIDEVMKAWQEDHQKVSWQDLQTLKAENEALRAQLSEKNIGQGEPSQAASDAYDRIDHFLRQKLDDHDYTHYSFDLDLVWGASIAPQQKPLTDEHRQELALTLMAAKLAPSGSVPVHCAAFIALCEACNIGEKK